MSAQTLTAQEVRDYFRDNYGHVNIQGVDDQTIQEYLNREYVHGKSIEWQMNLLYDYILSQDLTEIVE